MNINFELIELIEKEIDAAKKNQNTEQIKIYENLLLKAYTIIEKYM